MRRRSRKNSVQKKHRRSRERPERPDLQSVQVMGGRIWYNYIGTEENDWLCDICSRESKWGGIVELNMLYQQFCSEWGDGSVLVTVAIWKKDGGPGCFIIERQKPVFITLSVNRESEWYKKFSKSLIFLLPNERSCGNIFFVRLSVSW